MTHRGFATFSKNLLSSRDWYERLAGIMADTATAPSTKAFCDELVVRLKIDSMMLMRFPRDAGPQLLYGDYKHRRRSNEVEDYLLGNYAIDPFYLCLETCREEGLLALRDVIEENFDSSEYYRVHYKAAGLMDEVCFCCSDGQSGHIVLSLSRAVGKDTFSAEEIEAAYNIAPMVRAMMRSSWHSLANKTQPSGVFNQAESELHQHIKNARLNFGRSILTRREFDVLQLLLRGNSVDLIGRKLGISVETIKVHRKHIYAKLKIRSQAEIFTLFLDVVTATDLDPDGDPLAQYYRADVEHIH